MQAGRNYAPPRPGRHGPQSNAYAQQTQAQNQAALAAQRQQQEMEARRREREMAQRISRRPADRNMTDDVAQIAIGDGVERYTKLRDMERRLDATIMQKRLDLLDPYRQKPELDGKLRIWISNTAEGQPWQLMEEGGSGLGEDGTFDFADDSQATYRVKIEGRLIDGLAEDGAEDREADDDAMDHDAKDADRKPSDIRPKFSNFFRAIKIDFDRAPSLQSDGLNTIEWKAPTLPVDPSKPRGPEASFDTLEFQRKGDEEINVTVNLYHDHQPARYKLSKPLAELLDTEDAETAAVIAGIWDYVRALNLQEDDEHRRFICDDRLKAIFGLDTLAFPQLREILLSQGHLTELPPIQLPYTIRLDKAYISPASGPASAPTVYDVRVPLPSSLTAAVRSIVHSTEHLVALRAVQELDLDIATLVQGVNQGVQKHRFLTTLSTDPVGFVKRWVGSQRRDLEIVMAEGGRGYGEDGALPAELRKGGVEGFWGSSSVREGVGVYLARTRAH